MNASNHAAALRSGLDAFRRVMLLTLLSCPPERGVVMGYASVATALAAWLIAMDLFTWRFAIPVGMLITRVFHLRGDAGAFIAIPLFSWMLALMLISLLAGTWTLVAKWSQRRAAIAGISLTLALVAVGAINTWLMFTSRR
jgi:hypothetical protein